MLLSTFMPNSWNTPQLWYNALLHPIDDYSFGKKYNGMRCLFCLFHSDCLMWEIPKSIHIIIYIISLISISFFHWNDEGLHSPDFISQFVKIWLSCWRQILFLIINRHSYDIVWRLLHWFSTKFQNANLHLILIQFLKETYWALHIYPEPADSNPLMIIVIIQCGSSAMCPPILCCSGLWPFRCLAIPVCRRSNLFVLVFAHFWQ